MVKTLEWILESVKWSKTTKPIESKTTVNLWNLAVPVSNLHIARVRWKSGAYSLKSTITYIPDNFCLSIFGQGRNWSWHTNDIQWSLTFIAVPYSTILMIRIRSTTLFCAFSKNRWAWALWANCHFFLFINQKEKQKHTVLSIYFYITRFAVILRTKCYYLSSLFINIFLSILSIIINNTILFIRYSIGCVFRSKNNHNFIGSRIGSIIHYADGPSGPSLSYRSSPRSSSFGCCIHSSSSSSHCRS